LKKKLTPFPSSFHMSNEEGKKNINLYPPLPLKRKKFVKKIQGAPSPPEQ
jgi:hypothetical protein